MGLRWGVHPAGGQHGIGYFERAVPASVKVRLIVTPSIPRLPKTHHRPLILLLLLCLRLDKVQLGHINLIIVINVLVYITLEREVLFIKLGQAIGNVVVLGPHKLLFTRFVVEEAAVFRCLLQGLALRIYYLILTCAFGQVLRCF